LLNIKLTLYFTTFRDKKKPHPIYGVTIQLKYFNLRVSIEPIDDGQE